MDKSKRLELLERQVARLECRLRRMYTQSEQFVRGRFILFGVLALAVFLAFSQVSDGAGYGALVVAVVIFNVVAYYHRRLRASIQRHELWRRIKQTHIARIRLDWADIPPAISAAPAEHPFALDLDLVGSRSIHQLLNTAVSAEGSQRLLDWLLLREPDPVRIEANQALVRDLLPLTAFRDKLILNGQLASSGQFEGQRVLDWFAQHDAPGPAWYDLLLLGGLAAVNITLMALSSLGVIPPVWSVTLLLYILYSLARGGILGDVFSEGLALRDIFDRLNAVFRYLEARRYPHSPRLRDLCAPLTDPHRRPSSQLRRISWLVSAASLRGNPVLWFAINIFIPWDYGVAYLFQRRKAQVAAHLPHWLDRWFELEALCSLANFAYLNPDYHFPAMVEVTTFQGEALGHPLIPYEQKVCNDFELAGRGAVVIITGSNMAGKSSFLRTVGVNLALAYAGAPVNAAALTTGPFRLFTCIRVLDSVTDGFSYFYAEVRRLKALLDALDRDHPYPLFFLIDEIFKGTNNRERLSGSFSYIRALAGRNCMGIVSTHDLELVHLADEITSVRNQHFREEVVDGRMKFDYKLRPGPCPTTNALKIMQIEGLPVEDL